MARTRTAGKMSARDFNNALMKLGWNNRLASEIMGCSRRQVSAWRTGAVDVPGPVAWGIGLALKYLV